MPGTGRAAAALSPSGEVARRRWLVAELAAFGAGLAWLLVIFRSTLFLGRTTFADDAVTYNLPFLVYFVDGLLHGTIPFWNPFSHAGEPLTLAWQHFRVLDPIPILVVAVGRLVTRDLVTLMAWDLFLRAVVGALGVHVLLRRCTRPGLARVCLALLVLWSPLALGGLPFGGRTTLSHTAAWMLFFLFRLLFDRDYRWANWVGTAVAFGWSIQGYNFSGSAVAVAVVAVASVVFRRDDCRALAVRANVSRAALALAMVGAMSLQFLVAAAGREAFDFPLRAASGRVGHLVASERAPDTASQTGLVLPYFRVYETGLFTQPVDLAGLFLPPRYSVAPHSMAAHQFIGGVGILGALYGLVVAAHSLKPVWITLTAVFGLLVLGPQGGIHPLLYYVLPPLWLLRNTVMLVNFVLMGVLYLFAIGATHFIERWPDRPLFGPASGRQLGDLAGPGPLTRRLADPELVRFLATAGSLILFVASANAVALWTPTSMSPLPPTPFAILGIALLLWLLRHDLGPTLLMGVVLLGLAGSVLSTRDQADPLGAVIGRLLALALPLLLIGRGSDPTDARAAIGNPTWARMPLVLRVLALTALGVAFLFAPRPPPDIEWVLNTQRFPRVYLAAVGVLYTLAAVVLLLPTTTVNLLLRRPAGVRRAARTLCLAVTALLLTLGVRLARGVSFSDPWLFGRYSPRYASVLLLIALLTSLGLLLTARPTLARHAGILGFPLGALMRGVPRLRAVPLLVPALCSAVLALDLAAYAHGTTVGRWELRPRPDTVVPAPEFTGPPGLSQTRAVMLPAPGAQAAYDNPLIYPELFSRRAVALGTLTPAASPASGTRFATALEAPRVAPYFRLRTYADLVHSGLDPRILEALFAIDQPLVQFRPLAITTPDLLASLRTLPPDAALAQLARAVFLHPSTPPPPASAVSSATSRAPGTAAPPAPFAVRVLQSGFDALLLDVTVPAHGFLTYADGWAPHWRATLDGQPVPVLRANHHFKALALPPGRHRVEFRYQPLALQWALLAFYAVGLGGLAVAGFVTWRERRRAGPDGVAPSDT